MKKFKSKYCDAFFKTYPEDGSLFDQIFWLKSMVPDEMDPKTYPCVLGRHWIEQGAYTHLVENYWGSVNNAVITETKLQNIRNDYFNKSINYDFYIALSLSTNQKILHDLTSKYTLMPPCYSLPFFEALANEYGKSAVLEITMGRHNSGDDTVVIFVQGTTNGFFDFSQIPPFLPCRKPTPI